MFISYDSLTSRSQLLLLANCRKHDGVRDAHFKSFRKSDCFSRNRQSEYVD